MRSSGFRVAWFDINTYAAKLALAMVAASIVFALTKQSLGPWLVLLPGLVLERYAVWQPISYVLIAGNPMSVIFGALIIASIGGQLEQTWGAKRFLLFSLLVPFLSGLLMIALAAFVPYLRTSLYFGAEVMFTALWVGYGLWLGNAQTGFFFFPVKGYTLALIGIGFVFLAGAYGRWSMVLVEVFGVLLTLFYVKVGSPRLLWLKLQSWRLTRQLRGRAKHLKVISKDRNMPSDSDHYLH